MKKLHKVGAAALAAVILAGGLTGCGGNSSPKDGKISIKVGSWPTEQETTKQEIYEGYKAKMAEVRPDVEVIPDTSSFQKTQVLQTRAAANQLPTLFNLHFTGLQNVIDNGYGADLTDALKKKDMLEKLNPNILKVLTGEDGGIYAFPIEGYAMGLNINKKLFRQAGLVNADGTVMIPETYEQMAEYAKIIKEKTGKAGYCIDTTSHCGGWHFMNIAWSYGVDFMEQNEDGSYTATFNTQECVDAMQYVKDLKWKYDVLPDESTINQETGQKYLGIGEVAMVFDGPIANLQSAYEMNPTDYAIASLPAGPAGRYVQTGGTMTVFSPTATAEELDAALDWMMVSGFDPEISDESLASVDSKMKIKADKGEIILPRDAMSLWVNPERVEKEAEIRAKYANVDIKDCKNYLDMEGVTLRPEEPVCAQELYGTLDKVIQEVITNKDADVAALIEQACHDFQVNYLDKI